MTSVSDLTVTLNGFCTEPAKKSLGWVTETSIKRIEAKAKNFT